jgi:O-acetylhomoserine (thiol)-lyase
MAKIKDTSTWRFETKQVHIGQEQIDQPYGVMAVPIYMNTAYVFEDTEQAAGRFALTEDGYIYNRMNNPTTDILEKRIAALEEGSAALATASGAAAISYVLQALARAGDHIVSESTIYSGTFNLLKHTLSEFGIETTFVDPQTPDAVLAFEKAFRPNTKALYIETMGNPNSNVVDIEALAGLAHKYGVPLVVDSTFTPPCQLRPIEYGADVVIHSATKFINGHGTGLGGLIIESGKFDWKKNDKYPRLSKPNESYHGIIYADAFKSAALTSYIRTILMRDTGATISPFNAWLLLLGLETLSLRVERHIENTIKVIEYLNDHPKVICVHHPSLESEQSHLFYKKYFPKGAGSVFTFEYKGTGEETMAFAERLVIFSLVANLADAKSIVVHPASTTHSQLSENEQRDQYIYPNTIRLSIGIENADDLIGDLKQAL